MTTEADGDDFDVAKAVFDKLKDVPPERQKRILGWVAESLGVSVGGNVPRSPPSELPPLPQTPPPSQTATDIKSFIAAKDPKSDVQFATAVAYFYRFEAPAAQKRQVVDGAIVQEAARLAGRTRLSQPGKTLNNAKALGYLDSSGPGEFTVNSVGENLVAMALPGSSEAGNARARRKIGKPRGRGKRSGKR